MAWLRIDWGLYIAALGLSLIGAVLVWSGTHAEVGPALAVRHLINTGIGVTMAVLLLRFDVRWIRATAPWLYLAGLLGLLLVLTPLGVTVNGSRSWIHLPGGFSLQPAEHRGRKAAVAIAWNSQIQCVHVAGYFVGVVAILLALVFVCVLVTVRLQVLGHLGFEHLVQNHLGELLNAAVIQK